MPGVRGAATGSVAYQLCLARSSPSSRRPWSSGRLKLPKPSGGCWIIRLAAAHPWPDGHVITSLGASASSSSCVYVGAPGRFVFAAQGMMNWSAHRARASETW